MAHWFHRNPLKATVPLKYEGLLKTSSIEAQQQGLFI